MICFSFVFLLATAFPKLTDEVEVNVQGSMTLGRDVVETLKELLKKHRLSDLTGRRSLDNERPEIDDNTHSSADTISLLVNAAFLCRGLNLCQDRKGKLINNYIISLTKAVEKIFESLISDIDKKDNKDTVKVVIFEQELKRLILEIKKLLKASDEKIDEGNEVLTWMETIKRINSKFQDRAIAFASQRLEGNSQEIAEVKKMLTQKLVGRTTIVELEFEGKLCYEHGICSKSHECTKALNMLLENMKTVPDDTAKEFIRHFYETLPNTNFYYQISDVTAHEFQSILYDMAYAENIVTMNVLSTLHKSVGERLEAVNSNFKTPIDTSKGGDINLVHIILSDMDYFYNKPKKEPFHDFLTDFYSWSKRGGRFGIPLLRAMKTIQNTLSFEPDELVNKLVNEMRVFMEITVDPKSP